jgi:hypothetical protein
MDVWRPLGYGGEVMMTSNPEYLNKVKSDKKALEISGILEACHPTHAQRLFLVGFSKFCNYSMTDVLDIIREHNHWCDYSERITAYQVASVYHQRPQHTQNHSAEEVGSVTFRSVENPIPKVS